MSDKKQTNDCPQNANDQCTNQHNDPNTNDEGGATSVSMQTKSQGFHVDSSRIQAVPTDEQAAELQELGLQVFNQDEFEQGRVLGISCILNMLNTVVRLVTTVVQDLCFWTTRYN